MRSSWRSARRRSKVVREAECEAALEKKRAAREAEREAANKLKEEKRAADKLAREEDVKRKRAEAAQRAEAKALFSFAKVQRLYNVVKSHKPKGGSTQAGWERVANDMNDAADARRRGSTRRQTPTTAGCVGPISRTPRATRRWEMTLRWTS